MSSAVTFPDWRFVEHHPEAKSRDPLQSELLNQESFRPADALVRESIQNSLDAKIPDVDKVRVRIYVSGAAGALTKDEAAPYFQGIWPHIQECENGGQVASDLAEGTCRFVVIEDFGTIGLTGDPAATRVPEGASNNYYYFLRAEGISQKQSSSLGRWGVGKYVFPKSSGVNAFLAYTKRFDDDGPGLLVGQAVLMNHSLGDKDYDPDGWWAKPGPGVQMPVTDANVIEATTQRWNMTRVNESGVSIVIPYVDANLTAKDFVSSVIRAYFGAILAGRLEVEVEAPDEAAVVVLNSTTLLQLAEAYFDGDEREKVVSEIQLMATRASIPDNRRFTTNRVAARAGEGWSSATIDGVMAATMHKEIESGHAIQVTVPVELRVKGHGGEVSTESHLHVLLQQNESLKQKPLFMRGGIIVSDASRFPITGVRAICIVEESALTKMLGDAENPTHTTWTANDKIRSRYVRGGELLTIVKTAPHKIYQLVLDSAAEEQRIVFADIFAVPLADAGRKKRKTAASGGRKPGGRQGPGGPRTQPLTHIQREDQGGFSILPTAHAAEGGLKRVELALGYETRRGDALAKWRKDDFDLATFTPTITGGKIEKQLGNLLTAVVDDPAEFKLTVLGFDVNRDLNIRARGLSK
jgi:hypothetical protein